MSQTEDERKLPELQMDPNELEELRRRYVELIGFVPPRIQARTDLLARLDPELLSMQEAIRATDFGGERGSVWHQILRQQEEHLQG